MKQKIIRIIHKPSGELLAEGLKGWSMFSFEGNYYVSGKNIKSNGFRFSGIPGLCPYKFVYFWYHFQAKDGSKSPMLVWKYWIPNPLFPFIAFRLAIPTNHSEITIEIV